MPRFQGGVSVDRKGYLVIKAGPHRDVRVHTLVAEAMLGRELLRSEDVNHKDQNKLNPKWTNLEILDHTEHGYVSSAQAQFMRRREEEAKKEWEAEFGPGSTDFNPEEMQCQSNENV